MGEAAVYLPDGLLSLPLFLDAALAILKPGQLLAQNVNVYVINAFPGRKHQT